MGADGQLLRSEVSFGREMSTPGRKENRIDSSRYMSSRANRTIYYYKKLCAHIR